MLTAAALHEDCVRAMPMNAKPITAVTIGVTIAETPHPQVLNKTALKAVLTTVAPAVSISTSPMYRLKSFGCGCKMRICDFQSVSLRVIATP
mmetsp:Transcript_16459/g.27196  ORF Transcript_16459/g.27196 Transcript_16459/m.27196 type:complete len:92 (+) Transcript_16459:1203-1478(+)